MGIPAWGPGWTGKKRYGHGSTRKNTEKSIMGLRIYPLNRVAQGYRVTSSRGADEEAKRASMATSRCQPWQDPARLQVDLSG
jgi:hypothetical protein